MARLHYADIDLKLRDAFSGRPMTRKCTPPGNRPLAMNAHYSAGRGRLSRNRKRVLDGWLRWRRQRIFQLRDAGQGQPAARMSLSFSSPDPNAALTEQDQSARSSDTRTLLQLPMAPARLTNVPAFTQITNVGWLCRPTLQENRTSTNQPHTATGQTRPLGFNHLPATRYD